jgi:hypothetical protein
LVLRRESEDARGPDWNLFFVSRGPNESETNARSSDFAGYIQERNPLAAGA